MKEILLQKMMLIHLKLGIHKKLLYILFVILIVGCARFSQYALEDVEISKIATDGFGGGTPVFPADKLATKWSKIKSSN